jgi:hypothetical protein
MGKYNERDYYVRPHLCNKSPDRGIEHARYLDDSSRLKKVQDMVEEANRRAAKAKTMIDKVREIK